MLSVALSNVIGSYHQKHTIGTIFHPFVSEIQVLLVGCPGGNGHIHYFKVVLQAGPLIERLYEAPGKNVLIGKMEARGVGISHEHDSFAAGPRWNARYP